MATKPDDCATNVNPVEKILNELDSSATTNVSLLPSKESPDYIDELAQRETAATLPPVPTLSTNNVGTNSGDTTNVLEGAESTMRMMATAIIQTENVPGEVSFSPRLVPPLPLTTNESTRSSPGFVRERGTNPTQKKKKHIMISYSRTCYDQCDQIRKYLESKNYIVWMDVANLRGNFIDAIAEAIENSYIGLVCLNRAYLHSYWCKREAQFLEKKGIECIPCLLETPLQLENSLDFIIGGNNAVDFTKTVPFEDKMTNLINEITHHEERLSMTPPRRSLPNSPMGDFLPISPSSSSSLTRGEFDHIVETFRQWVQENRENLRRTDQRQTQKFVNELLQNLQNDENLKKLTKEEFLKNLSRFVDRQSASRPREENFGRTVQITADLMMKTLFFCLLTWALKTIYNS